MLLSRGSRGDDSPGLFHHWCRHSWLVAAALQPLLLSSRCFFLCVAVWAPLSLIKTPVIGSRAHLCNPGHAHLKILNLITKTLSNKFRFQEVTNLLGGGSPLNPLCLVFARYWAWMLGLLSEKQACSSSLKRAI